MTPEEWFSRFHIGSHCGGHGESSEHIGFSDWEAKPHLEALLKLARLGIWAEEHGIKMVEAVDDNNDALLTDGYTKLINQNDSAMAALPKDWA